MACREVLQKYLYGKINAVDIPAELAAAFKKVGYVNSQQEAANLAEKTKEIMRYVNAEEAERSHRHFIDPREITINIFGTDVKVKPDAVCVDGNRIEVIKYKFKKPDMAQTGSTKDKSVTTSLECYALFKYGCSLALSPDDIVAAGYIFTGKDGKHEHDIDFGLLEPVNTTAYRMLSFPVSSESTVDNIYLPVWTDSHFTGFRKSVDHRRLL
jgi:hypothetical protein